MTGFTDIMPYLKNMAIGMGFRTSYGNRKTNNLLNNTDYQDQDGTIYFLHEAPRRSRVFNTDTGSPIGMRYSGVFFLTIKSDLDENYDVESDNDEQTGKFYKHILPLLKDVESKFFKKIVCEDLIIESWNIEEVVNFGDANRDGLMIYYTIYADGFTG